MKTIARKPQTYEEWREFLEGLDTSHDPWLRSYVSETLSMLARHEGKRRALGWLLNLLPKGMR